MLNNNLETLIKSKRTQENLGVVIIDPFLVEDNPDYTLEDLERKFAQYTNLPDNLKDLSDSESTVLWNSDVRNMYDKMRSFFSNSVVESNDLISLYREKLKRSIPKNTITESVISDNLVANIEDRIKQNSFVDYDEDIPQITPFFTPDEYQDINNTEINDYEYITYNLGDPRELHEKIKEAMKIFSEEPSEENEKNILKLGWNPSVEPTADNFKFARDRQVKWFNEHKKLQIIDISNINFPESLTEAAKKNPLIKMEPVYIVLLSHGGLNSKLIRWYTKSNYSHAGISFDESLKNIYSFNAATPDKKKGMSIESIDFYKNAKDVHIEVVTFFVTPEIKKRLRNRVLYYVANKDKTTYDFMNFFNILLKKTKDTSQSMAMICSQFVDNILKSCKIDLTGKPSNLVFPGDFETPVPGSKLFVVFKDALVKFKPSIIKNKIKSIFSLGQTPDQILTVPATEAVSNFLKTNDISSLMVVTESAAVNQCIKEFLELLKPELMIDEARHIPIRFNKKGDLFINLPSNLEQEYQDAHKLLTSYNEDNLEGIKHELAHLFYINSLLEKRIRKAKNNDKQYKQCIDLRARVLNDFRKYIKIVNRKEKNFNFESYLKNSEYYSGTIRIDRPTLKYSGALIKDFIKAAQGI